MDFKKLNDQVRRPAHPVKAAKDVVSGIGSAKFFTTLDARYGYWQIPLAEEASSLTTFIVPYGRYRYLRNPQGLISAGDEFNRRLDIAFEKMSNFGKVLDDCLVYDESLQSHYDHVREVLLCGRANSINISEKKFRFCQQEVDFCGYVVNEIGWRIDEAKAAAISDFPIPANRTDLRSFVELGNQFSEFTPRLAEVTVPLRSLLKSSREFKWNADHTEAFEATKSALVSPPTLAYFQPGTTFGWRQMLLR